jgi:hypothetical protein
MRGEKKWTTILLILLLLVLFLVTLSGNIADPDLWGYLAFGKLFWETGHFPFHDVFTFVPTHNLWIYHEWLTGIIFYPLYKNLGGPGLQIIRYGSGLAIMGLIYFTARQRGSSPLAAFLLLLTIDCILLIGFSPVRAQIFTYLFFTLTLYLLETAKKNRNWLRLGLLIPIQILWCNLHGGFLAGLGLLILYAVGEALSRRPFWPYVVALLLSGLATLINPYGLQYWSYIIYAITVPRHELTEWIPLYQCYQDGIIKGNELIYFLAILVFAVSIMIWARWREVTAILALAVTLFLGLQHARHIVFFMILMGAYLAVPLTSYLEALKFNPKILLAFQQIGWRIPTLAGLGIVIMYSLNFISQEPFKLKIPSKPAYEDGVKIYYPVNAVKYIQAERLTGNLLTDYDWGNYLLWMLYPQCKVALDGRFESVYPVQVTNEYFDFLFGRANWQHFLDKYFPDMILLKIPSKTYDLINRDPKWRQVYFDSGSALLVRN